MVKNIKQSLKSVISNNLNFNLLRYINRHKLIILYYHRVLKKKESVTSFAQHVGVDIDCFNDQMKYLSQYYNAISEKEIISAIEGKSKIPEYSVWVTLDDGYLDNFDIAYPILKQYKIPATFFVTTGYINKDLVPCEDYIEEAVRVTNLKEIKFSLNNTEDKFSLNTEEDKMYAIKSLLAKVQKNNLEKEKYIEKNLYLTALVNCFEVPIEDIKDLFMGWDEIKDLNRNGFSIGAHTINHNILSKISNQEVAKEISESKNQIERKLGKTIYSFAYPRGKKSDFNTKNCFPLLETNGFKLSVTTTGGYNSLVLNKNRFLLKRIGINYTDNLNNFKMNLSTGSFWQF